MKQKASDQVKVLLAEDLASDAELEQRELKPRCRAFR